MPTNHTGSSAGLTLTDPITISNPNDGEDLTAASNDVATKKLADFIDLVRDAFATPVPVVIGAGGGAPVYGTNWGGSANAAQKARYWVDPATGRFHMQGLFRANGAASGSGAQRPFTLPIVPVADASWPITAEISGSIVRAVIFINSTGQLTVLDAAGGSTFASGDLFYVDSISFRPGV